MEFESYVLPHGKRVVNTFGHPIWSHRWEDYLMPWMPAKNRNKIEYKFDLDLSGGVQYPVRGLHL